MERGSDNESGSLITGWKKMENYLERNKRNNDNKLEKDDNAAYEQEDRKD